MIEFIEECRREWRRLGVPDPIANEMAADLTADIEEAQAEGGSAEDVLGESFFDPRRFAAAWAGARGVTAPSVPALAGPSSPPERERPRWYRPAAALAVPALACLGALLTAALVVGRNSTAVAASAHRILTVPGPARLFVPGPGSSSLRFPGPGAAFVVRQAEPLALLAFALLFVVAVVGLCLAFLFWSPWSRRRSNRRLG